MRRKGLVLLFFIISIMLVFGSNVYAIDASVVKETDYTEAYKKWLELSAEDKAKTITPRKYEVRNSRAINLFGGGRITRNALATDYDLREDIPENVTIRNQMGTGECWAFTGIAVLESNLALRDKLEDRGVTVYNYSERHMDYSTATKFLNNEENKYGYREDITLGGWWESAEMYLTNGSGAILEKDMPFENNQNVIALSELQNKTVQTKVEDTVYFEEQPNTNTLSTEYKEWQRQVKQHIINNGGISTAIYMVDAYDSISAGSYYCNTDIYGTNHLVTIIGWDDEYEIDNFTGSAKPTYPGAWIVKNSWGDGSYTIQEWKVYMFGLFRDNFVANGWYKADDMPDSFAISQLESNGYTYDTQKQKYCSDEYKYDGYWYISYEDALIGKWLNGIKNAKTDVDYDNLYQHDIFGATSSRYISKSNISGDEKKVYLANVFKKNTNTIEKLKEVSVITNQSYICRVYVNPNGTSKKSEDLQPVTLQEGAYKKIDAGYNTLKFEESINIAGDNFVVVVEVETADSTESSIIISTEKNEYPVYTATFNSGESFLSYGEDFNNNSWIDVGTQYSENLCIKAFTTSGAESIRISNMPEKTEYIEGTNFDSSKMIIMATIDGQEIEITEYEIINGTDLSLEQTSVTIKYEGKEVEVPITVIEKPEGSINDIQDLSKTYDGIAVSNPIYTKVGDGAETFEWYSLEGNTETKLETAPTNAGSYKVKIILAEGENYKAAQAEKTFTISKAIPTVTEPTSLTATYGQTLADVELPEGFSWELDLSTSVGNVGNNIFKAAYTPTDTLNYEIVTNIDIEITVNKATYDMSGISFTDATYAYDGTEKSIVISGALPEGVVVSYENNIGISVGEYNATAMFTGDSINYNEIPNMTATLTISAMQGSISNIQDLSKIYDGEPVLEPTFNKTGDGQVSVEWYKVENGTEISLNEVPTNAGTYKVKVIMSSTTNYTSVQAEKEFTIEKAQGNISSISDISKTYDGVAVANPICEGIGDGQVTLEWYNIQDENEIKLDTAPINAGNYKVKAILVEGTNYKGTEAEKEFTINKANPEYTLPTGLTTIEGDKLSRINLPEGFSFEQDLETRLLQIGENIFTVKYTPQDTENYNTVTGIEVVVTVIAKPEIDLGNYIETKDEVTGETYIENISQNTTIGKIQEEIGSNKTVEIYKGEEKVENTDTKIETGMEVRITLENNQTVSYKAVVKGDVNKDGDVDISDLVLLARYVARTDKNVEPIKLRAMEVNNNDNRNIVDMSDLVIMARYVARKINQL